MTDSRLSLAALSHLARFLERGPSLVLATCDPARRPEVVRCAGGRVMPDGTVRVLIPMPEGRRSLANLAATGRGALTALVPVSCETLQVKAKEAAVVDWPEQQAVVAEYVAALATQGQLMGLPRKLLRRAWSSRFTAVALMPEELFEQTPGPRAGMPVHA